MLAKSTGRWAKQRKAEIRDPEARYLRRVDRMSRRSRPLKQTEAAEEADALGLHDRERQRHAASQSAPDLLRRRREMLRLTELMSIDSNYFTQTLLIAFMRKYP